MAVVSKSCTEEFCPEAKKPPMASTMLELLPLVLPLVAYTTRKGGAVCSQTGTWKQRDENRFRRIQRQQQALENTRALSALVLLHRKSIRNIKSV